MKTKSEKFQNEILRLDINVNTVTNKKLPIKVSPFDHQIKGYDMVCKILEFNKEVV